MLMEFFQVLGIVTTIYLVVSAVIAIFIFKSVKEGIEDDCSDTKLSFFQGFVYFFIALPQTVITLYIFYKESKNDNNNES